MRGLPQEALTFNTLDERLREDWDVQTELLAQSVELLSVLAAERKIKEPFQVPRPQHLARSASSRPIPGADGDQPAVQQDAYKRGIAVLAASTPGR